jgi:dipeptidyl aminopeptidase/acylaminoacyl peptidase
MRRSPLSILIGATCAAALLLLGACSNMAASDTAVVIFPGAHEFGSTAVGFSLDGDVLVSGGHRGNVKLWDIRQRKHRAELKLHDGAVRAIAAASTSLIATASDDGQVIIWHNERILSQPTSTLVTSLAWFQDRLVSGHDDGILRVWDKKLNPVQEIELGAGVEALATNGRQLAVALPDRILVIDGDFQVSKTLDTDGVTPRDLQFSPDGQRLAAGGWFRLHLWDLASGQHQSVSTEHDGLLTSVSFSPDGKHLVSLGRHSDSAIRIVDTQDFSVVRRYQAHELCGAMIRYSPDGQWLASASDDESVRLYDLSKPYQPRRGHERLSQQANSGNP